MTTQTYHEVITDESYNEGFKDGEKSLQKACLVLCDDFLYRTTRSILNKAKGMMDEGIEHGDCVEYIVKNSTLIRSKRIDSFNS